MTFKRLTVLSLPEEVQSATGRVARVFAAVDALPPQGLPLRAEVGGQPVDGFGITQSMEPTLSGYLKQMPQVGDELVVKVGTVEIPTGLTIENLPNA